jgi:hypothetical protein
MVNLIAQENSNNINKSIINESQRHEQQTTV